MAGCAPSNTASTPAPASAAESIRVPTGAGGQTSSLTTTTVANVSTVPRPIDRVWLVMPSVFDSLAIPVTAVDPAAHSLGSGHLKVRRRLGGESLRIYLNCGDTQGMPNSETYDIRVSTISQLTPNGPGATTITTTVSAMGRPVSVSGESVRCSSTGALETRLGNIVAARLNR